MKCKEGKTAQRVNKIWLLPPIIVIHMKRFLYDDNDELVKNEYPVDFEVNKLMMNNYMFNESPIQNTLYNLYAVVVYYFVSFS